MSIISLSPHNFRNLNDYEPIHFHDRFNLISGQNASGKTSLLEAIYFLSTGKSFRTHLIDNVIRADQSSDHFVLHGILCSSLSSDLEQASDFKIGMKRVRSEKPIIKINNESVFAASNLAKISPTLIIQPSSFELLDGSPKVRRRFLDWGVFHVEHSFSDVWKEFIYCLKQRNTLLRSDRIDDLQQRIWDKKLSELGQRVNELRNSFLEQYKTFLEELIRLFELPEGLEIRYYKGWEKNSSLPDVLAHYRLKDKERRYTQFGPQRADIKITINGRNAEQVLSRGQQKLLVLAMHIAHIELVSQVTQKRSVTLIDDVSAELDQKNLALVLGCLAKCNAQIICTVIDGKQVMRAIEDAYGENSYKMFHVEHGKILETKTI